MLALKQYELSNHLGNVLATVLDRRTMTSDKVLAYQTNFTGTTDGWTAGWSAAGTIYSATPPTNVAQNNNRLQCTATVSMGGVRKVIATTIGTAYTLTMDIDMGTAEGLYIMPRTTNGSNEFTGTNLAQVYLTSSGTYAVNFTATTSTTQLLVEKAGAVAQTFYIDNVKVEQSTPTLSSYPIADVVNAQYYYPFGSTMKTWKADGDDYRFGFNGQEKDNEVSGDGNSYTAEYWQYDSRLGRRFNIDPKPNPSISVYACFNNNPLFYSDPYGDTVKYNSFADRLIVGMARILNRDFNKDFKTLKSSTETYVFRKGVTVDDFSDVLSTDGDKIYINYAFEKQESFTGQNRFSTLYHETKHAIQFEYGELGFHFNKEKQKWESSASHDMMDELEGFKAGFRIGKISYFNTKTGKLTPTNLANFQLLQTDADKIQYIYLITDKPKLSYRSLPTSALNNQNPVKVKNKSTYKLPYRQR